MPEAVRFGREKVADCLGSRWRGGDDLTGLDGEVGRRDGGNP
jgi:hypothetical protein